MKDNPKAVSRITQPIRTAVQRFAYLGLVLSAFGLMMLGKVDAVLVDKARVHMVDAVAPILDALSRPLASIERIALKVGEVVRVYEQNSDLKQHNERLLQWQAAAQQLEAENRILRRLLNFAPGPDASFVSARVIADTGGAFVHSLIVNAGSREGVRKGQAAVTGEGLVGRIAAVGQRSARLLLITDLNSRIPVFVEPGRTRAILAGDNSDRPRLTHLSESVTVRPGDRVVTSGHGGVFPPGLPVGVVAAVGESGISIVPYVERERLEYVRVIEFGLSGILEGPPAAERPARRSAGRSGRAQEERAP